MEAVVDADSISVAIRIRPLSDVEIAAGHVAVFQCIPKCNQIGQLRDGQFLAGQTFEFDRVYDESTTTNQIYASSARSLVADVVDGINGTIFACKRSHSPPTRTSHLLNIDCFLNTRRFFHLTKSLAYSIFVVTHCQYPYLIRQSDPIK